MIDDNPTPPEHLSEVMQTWWKLVLENYDLDDSQLKTLQLAAEAFDRSQWARVSCEANQGLVYTDRFGQPRARPEATIARENAKLFATLVRELCLDVAVPDSPRIPRPANRYH